MGIVEEAHNVQVLGSGKTVVVLGHGFGTDQSVWKYLVPHLLGEDYRVVLYDNMGAGTTNPDYFDFQRYSTIYGFAYDLIAILQELEIEHCVFVGHSFSAMVGALASVSHPHLFSKILMLSGTPRLLNDEDYYGGFEAKDIEEIFDGQRSNYESWCWGFAPIIVGGDMGSPAMQEFSRTLFNMRPDIAMSLTHVIFLSDTRHVLPDVTVPCHILQSSNDMAVPVAVSEYLQRNIGGKSVVDIMPTSGHLPQLSSPEVVVPFILRHLRLVINE